MLNKMTSSYAAKLIIGENTLSSINKSQDISLTEKKALEFIINEFLNNEIIKPKWPATSNKAIK